MNIGINNSLTPATVTQTASVSELVFSALPAISPTISDVGAMITLDYGSAGPDATLSGTLMLDGVDVTDAITMQGETSVYTSNASGALMWLVQADDGAGETTSQIATGTVAVPTSLSVDLGVAQFEVAGAQATGVDATGRAYVVAPDGAQLSAMTPAPVDVDGRLAGGAQKNPQRLTQSVGDQGYDARLLDVPFAENYVSDLSLSAPDPLVPGDRIVKAIPRTEVVTYGGPLNLGYATLHVVSQVLPENAVLGPVVGWDGQQGPEYYTVDIAAVMALLQNRPSGGITFPPFSVLYASLAKHAPVYAQNSATYRGSGYERLMPQGIAGAPVSDTGVQYGRDIAEVFDIAALSLHYNFYNAAEKELIIWALIRHGIEWVFPIIGSNIPVVADGGHQQFWQFAGLMALIATGREGEVASFMQDTGGGNWDQYFEITEGLIASDFSAHDDPNKPQLWRNRTLDVQPVGTVLSVPISDVDKLQAYIPARARVMRNGRPVANVLEETRFATSGFIDVPIDAQPFPPFTAGDVIHFEAGPGAMKPGRYEWLQRHGYSLFSDDGLRTIFSPSVTNQYRSLQRNAGSLMALRGMGYFHPSMEALWGYLMDTSGLAPYPAADNAYTPAFGPFYGLDEISYSAVEEAWAFEKTYYDTIAQVYDAVPTDALSLSHVVAPGTPQPGPAADGQIIGLVAGQTRRSVEISGLGGDGGSVQIRVLRQSDDTEVLGWFHAGTVSNGRFRTVVDVPKSDGWLKLEMRYAGGSSVYTDTTKWAVGYKFMMLGQSQMTIMLKDTDAGYTMSSANLGTASFYSWQQYNLNGATGEAESLSILDGVQPIPDGVASFVEQYRVLDPYTPVQIMRESVNGTSILGFTDDANLVRSWSDLTDKTQRYGGDVTAVLENWNTSNQGALEGHEDIDILQGINAHMGEHNGTPDHSLRDVLQPGYVFGTMPATRNSKLFNDVQHSAQKITRANALNYPVGLSIGDYQIDVDGGPHPHSSGEGNVLMGARIAILAGRTVGVETPANPHMAGTALRSTDGSSLDIAVVLPNGGTLTSPNPNNISGFEVDEGAGFSNSGFTTSIVGDAVRLTKEVGSWAPAISLQIRRQANLDINNPMDAVKELEIVAGEIYETWDGDTTGYGLPVHGTLVDGKWSLEGMTVSLVTQEDTGGSTQTPQLSLLKVVENTDTASSTANRERWLYGAFVEAGIAVPAGTEFLIGAAHIPAQAGGTDFNDFQARNSGGASIGTVSVLETALSTPGGASHSVRALGFTQTAIGLDLRAYSTSRQAMTALTSYKLDGVTLSGAISGSGSNTVTLTGVVVGSSIVAFAQGDAPIVWSGVTEETAYTSSVKSIDRFQSSATGTGEGTVNVSASGATELVVIALPPV